MFIKGDELKRFIFLINREFKVWKIRNDKIKEYE